MKTLVLPARVMCIVFAGICGLLVAEMSAQEPPTTPSPWQLSPRFSDSFQQDTRADYQIKGQVSWRKGRLALSSGSSVTRTLNGGPRVELQARIQFPPLTERKRQSETIVEFHISGATKCYVTWTRVYKNGQTMLRVQLLDTIARENGIESKIVRQTNIPDESGQWRIVYRYGLLRVLSSKKTVLSGYIPNGPATVSAVRTAARRQPVALEHFAIAASQKPKVLGNDDKKDLLSTNYMSVRAVRLLRGRNPGAALKLAQQAAAIRQRIVGQVHPLYAASLHDIAFFTKATGKQQQVEQLHKRALQIQRKTLGVAHPIYNRGLGRLGTFYQSIGDFEKAKPLLVNARESFDRVLGKSHPYYVQTTTMLARLYVATGELAKAEPLYLELRDTQRRLHGEGHPAFAASLNRLAQISISRADYAKAEPLLLKSRDVRKKIYGESHRSYALSLNDLAVLYSLMGDFAKAEPLYIQAREVNKKVLGKSSLAYALSLQNLASFYRRTHRYAKAKSFYLQALEIRRELQGDVHPEYATLLDSLGVTHEALGEYTKADECLRSALKVRKQALGKRHPSYARSLMNLAGLHVAKKDYTNAESLLTEARDVLQRTVGRSHPVYLANLLNHADLHDLKRDHSQARSLLIQALEIQLKLKTDVLTTLSEAQALNHLATQAATLDLLLSISHRSQRDWKDDYEFVWRGRRLLQRVTALRHKQLQQVMTLGSSQTKDLFRDYERVRRLLGRLILSGAARNADHAKQRNLALEQLSNQKEQLERKLVTKLPQLASTIRTRRRHHAELMKRLPQHAVFIDLVRFKLIPSETRTATGEWIPSKPSYVAFVLRPGDSTTGVQAVTLGSAKTIDSAARDWRRAIARDRNTRAAAARLSRLLWKPLSKVVPAGTKVIYLCPDGTLSTIPWSALPAGNQDEILLEKFAIAMVPHGHFLLENSQSRTTKVATNSASGAPDDNSMLVVGEVLYNRGPASVTSQLASRSQVVGRSMNWQPLPGSKRELESIERYAAANSTVKIRKLRAQQASTGRVLSELTNVRFAHIATHGFFADKGFRSYLQMREEWFEGRRDVGVSNRSSFAGRNPLVLSGLVLAGANLPRQTDRYGVPTSDGGILTAEAIASLPLFNLELVVLSACETGLGDVAGGEGVYGLQRAFLTAGTANVIASLWKVDDNATAALMQLFYHKLWSEKKTPLRALRESQLALYRYPNQIKALSTARGLNFKKVVRVVSNAPEKRTRKTTRTDLWAAFVLSGTGQ